DLPCLPDAPGCVIPVPCTQNCQPIVIRVEAPPRSKCTAALFAVTGKRAATGFFTLARRLRRITKPSKGTVDADGMVDLDARLNPLGRKLLRKSGGALAVTAEVHINEPRGGKQRTLRRAVALARKG